MGPNVEFRVLGPLEVVAAHGRPVDLGGARQRRLLALLLIHVGRVVPAPELVDAIWPEPDRPQHAERALRTYVSRLRKVLADADPDPDPDVDGPIHPLQIRTEPPGYRLVAGGSTSDAGRLADLVAACRVARDQGELARAVEATEEARRLWRGRPYAEVADEPWAAAEVQRLEDLAVTAAEERIDVFLLLGRHEQVVGELERLCADHPLRERVRGQLMLALHRSGRQADALRTYQRYRAELAEQTGLEPGPTIRALEARVATADPSLLEVQPEGRALRAYRLVERIGEGSFAVVWRGLQPSVGREVAIKQIRAELANLPDFIRRFEAEAHLVAHLEHPHIVPLYDYWREPGSAYLVLRWLRGGTLEERLADGPLPVADCVRLVTQVGGALDHAHRAGVVHRDVKSANVLCDGEGNFFLADFGIALEPTRADGGRPEAALSAGSPAYASPEQLRRQPVGPPADVHGLGIVVYEALTGLLPFPDERTRAGLLQRQLHDPIPSVRPIRPELPAAVDEVLARATAKHPADRYPAVAELVDALASAVSAVSGESAGARVRGASTLVSGAGTNPYKGLRAFTEADAADFAGRTRLVNRLVDALGRPGPAGRFLAVVGPSGSGKSSLVRAGLLPMVRAGKVVGGDRWFVTTMVPGAHPFEELEAALARVASDGPHRWAEVLAADERGISRAVKGVLPDEEAELLLVVDQFEELFTLSDDEPARARFLRALCAAVTDPRSRLRLVLTLRADFWDRPLRYPELAALLDGGAVPVGPLAPDELERAIVDPAARAGCEFEPGLVSEIVADVADQPGALPMLQYALTELFERQVSGLLRIDAYREIGGVVGALARRAEELHRTAATDEQAAARRLFQRLVTLGEGVEDTRRRVRRPELADDPATERVIEQFGHARLLSFDREPVSREPTVEVAHEALIRQWPRLRAWLDEDRDGLRIHRHLTDAVRSWQQSGQDAAELYRGARLDGALDWSAAHPSDANPAELAFLDAARARRDADAARERRQVRRLRTLLAGVGLALVLALLAGGLALAQRSEARRNADVALAEADRAETEARNADRDRLIAESKALAPTNRYLATLLAVEANRLDPTFDTRAAIFATLMAEPRFVRAFNTPEAVIGIQPQADGTLFTLDRQGTLAHLDLASGRPVTEAIRLTDVPGTIDGLTVSVSFAGTRVAVLGDSRVTVFDAESGRPIGPAVPVAPSPESNHTGMALSPDGTTVYVAGGTGTLPGAGRGTVARFDAATGLPAGPDLAGHSARIWSVMPTPDGSRLVTGSYDGSVIVWDLASGQPAFPPLAGHRGLPGSISFSRDGRYLATVTTTPVSAFVWDLQTGARVLGPIGGGTSISSLGLFDGAGRVLVAGDDGAVIAYDIPSGTEAYRLDHNGLVAAAAPTPDGSGLLFAGPTVGLYEIGERGSLGRAVVQSRPATARWSPDGSLLAVLAADRSVSVVDVATGRPLFPALRDERQLSAVLAILTGTLAIDPTGEVLAVGRPGGVVELRALRTGALLRAPLADPALGAGVTSLAFNRDGSRLAVGGNGVAVFDVASGARVGQPFVPLTSARNAFSVAFHPDGRRIYPVSILSRVVRLFDPESGGVVERELPQGTISSLSLSPDGSALAAPSSEGLVWFFDPNTLERVGEPVKVRNGTVTTVSWFPSGRQLLAGGVDGRARLVDLDTRKVLEPGIPGAAAGELGSSYVSPDGRRAALPGSGGLVVWDLDSASWRDRACEAIGRNLTPLEWSTYLPNAGPYRKTCEQWPEAEA